MIYCSPRREEGAQRSNYPERPPPYVGAYEKRGQEKVFPLRKPKRFAFDFAGRPFEGRVLAGEGAVCFWLSGFRRLEPRIHSTVRFGERAQAHMGDSGGAVFFFSSKLLFLLSLLRLPGPRSWGSCRARGPASYGNACRHGPSRTSGSLPASRIRAAAGPLSPAAPAPRQPHVTFAVGCGSFPRKRCRSNSFSSCQSTHRVPRTLRWVFSRACSSLPVRVRDCW